MLFAVEAGQAVAAAGAVRLVARAGGVPVADRILGSALSARSGSLASSEVQHTEESGLLCSPRTVSGVSHVGSRQKKDSAGSCDSHIESA